MIPLKLTENLKNNVRDGDATGDCGAGFPKRFPRKAFDGSVSVQDMMNCLNCPDKTVYSRLKKLGGKFVLKKGRIYPAIAEEQRFQKFFFYAVFIYINTRRNRTLHTRSGKGSKARPSPSRSAT